MNLITLNTLILLVCFCTQSLGNPVINSGIRYESTNQRLQDDMHVVVLSKYDNRNADGLRDDKLENDVSYRYKTTPAYNKRVKRGWIGGDDPGWRATSMTPKPTTSPPPPPSPPPTTKATTTTKSTAKPTTKTPIDIPNLNAIPIFKFPVVLNFPGLEKYRDIFKKWNPRNIWFGR